MKLTFDDYLDKVYGCWLGKCVIGTLGAPYEGMKQLNHLQFSNKMIEEMLPNDDLDLQVLWLKALEEVGVDINSNDLAKAFKEYNIKWPGEYAYFRTNYSRGIRPPYSGIYSNDFYKEGMGCPIRAEIFGMILPGNPELSQELSRLDGTMDHNGASVEFEAFFASMISNAFFISDIETLINESLKYVDKNSRSYALINDTLTWCKESDDLESIRSKIIGVYGHSDCTNSFQNIGFTLMCLLKSNYNPLEAGVIASNLGFDTDCTAGNSGSLLGLILGANKLKEFFDISKVNYKLNLRYKRETDSVYDLALDTAKVGYHFLNNYKNAVNVLSNFPYEDNIVDRIKEDISLINYYLEDPYIEPLKKKKVQIEIKNNSNVSKKVSLSIENNEHFIVEFEKNEILVKENSSEFVNVYFILRKEEYISRSNIFKMTALDELNKKFHLEFGLIGKRSVVYYGPFWENNVELDLSKSQFNYGSLLKGVSVNDRVDNLRKYQLNMVSNFNKEYMSYDEIVKEEKNRLYEYSPKQAFLNEYSFNVKDFSTFNGPAVYYLKETVNLPHRNRVCIFFGHTDSVELFIDGKLFISSNEIENWTPENKHFYHFYLDEGDHDIIYKIDAKNGNQKLSFILNIDDETGQYPWPDFKTKLLKGQN